MKIEEEVQVAHQYYQQKRYQEAADLFESLADQYEEYSDFKNAAEMKNNASVAYLMIGDYKKAYESAKDTHIVFENYHDFRNCGLALGNQASALEHIGEKALAFQLFTQAKDCLDKAGDKESKAYVLKRISTLQIQQGKQFEALGSMSSALDNIPQLSTSEKILKKLTDFITKIGTR